VTAPQRDWRADIRALLAQRRSCFLATSGEGGPECSMAPFALHDGALLLHLSALARHRANIERSPTIGLMICALEQSDASPLALPRLSMQGAVSPVPDADLAAARAAYLRRIPDAEPLFSFADFRLFRFAPEQIHWVGGFGQARKLDSQQWHLIQAA